MDHHLEAEAVCVDANEAMLAAARPIWPGRAAGGPWRRRGRRADGRDHPDSLADQVRWLRCAGLVVAVPWQTDDAAVVNADRFPPLEAAAVPGS